MSIAVIITDRNTDELCHLLRTQLPETHIQQWPNIESPKTVELAVLWNHPSGITNEMPHLKVVVSMGAGMDHIDQDKHIAPHIKRSRIVTPILQQNMAQYVLQHILADHRHAANYQQQQSKKVWKILELDHAMPTIGFLGLGALGGYVADQCAALGFQTLAWTQLQKHHKHRCHHGESGLRFVCENSDYLVVLLPLNDETKQIVNQSMLNWCRNDAVLINVARGDHVNEKDLINALDNSQIRKAVLDVFQNEPLPQNHSFWSHPKIIITPHSSSRSDVLQTAEAIVKAYRAI